MYFHLENWLGGSTCPLRPPPVPTSMRCMYHDRQRVTRLLEPNWPPSCGERVSSFGHQLCDHVGVTVLLEGSRLPVTGLSGIGEAAVLIFNPKGDSVRSNCKPGHDIRCAEERYM